MEELNNKKTQADYIKYIFIQTEEKRKSRKEKKIGKIGKENS